MTRYRHVSILVLVLLVPLAFAGTLAARRWMHRGPGVASVGKAIDRFHTATTEGAPARGIHPLPGVYTYKGSGIERLSFLDTRQRQGPTDPGTLIARADGCWTLRIEFNSFHSQSWNRCMADGRLVEHGGSTIQKFDFVMFTQREHTDVSCDPPFVVADFTAAAGTQRPVHCVNRSETTKTNVQQVGTIRVIGKETVPVGGAEVPSLHVHQQMQLRGDQSGGTQADIWFALTTGIPVRERHTIRVVSPAPAPINQVTYTETGEWQLSSLTPSR